MEWKTSRNETFCEDTKKQVPDDVLETSSPEVICKWFGLYVAETQKLDGSCYPPKTIYLLLNGLLRHMRFVNPNCPNFFDLNNKQFSSLHTIMDNLFRKLRSDGVGSSSKAAAVFTREDEDKLWDLGVLGTENPKALLRAVFFLNGKNFSLRGGEEHRSLRFTQIERKLDPNCYIYTENTSKNRTGS